MGGIIPKIRAIDPDADPMQQNLLQDIIEGDTYYYNYFQLPGGEPGAGTYQAVFRPNAHPEGATVDGYVRQSYDYDSGVEWLALRGAAGSDADDTSPIGVYIKADRTPHTDRWIILGRSILLFDTSSLPDNCTINSAVLSIYGNEKLDALGITPNINVYGSAPASNTALVAGDYDSLGVVAFCDNAITYATFEVGTEKGWTGGAWNSFLLNSSGLAAISKTGITKLGLKNANYDITGSAPSWTSAVASYLLAVDADLAGAPGGYPELAPKLTVNFAVYGEKYIWIEVD
jgi:hypothetical protein